MTRLEENGTEAARVAHRADVAAYVSSMTRDLGSMSRRSGLMTLAYLLDMASLEAETASRNGGGAPAPAGRSAPGLDRP